MSKAIFWSGKQSMKVLFKNTMWHLIYEAIGQGTTHLVFELPLTCQVVLLFLEQSYTGLIEVCM